MNDYEHVLLEVDGAVATIRLNRASQRNAINDQLARDFVDALEHVGRDASIRAVVVTGEGKTFCAGADLVQFESIESPEAAEGHLMTKYKPFIDALVSLPKPVIGAINGAAAGAGMSIALACDFRVMTDTSALYPAFVSIGLVPDAGASWFLVKHLGYSRALEFLVTGKPMDASQCLSLGLTNRVVRPDQLVAEAQAWARQLATGPTAAIALTKKIAQFAAANDLGSTFELEAKSQVLALSTEDHQEGIKAFSEKRSPSFTGK